MSYDNKVQENPMTIDKTIKKTDDGRHKARCIYYNKEKKRCECNKNPYYYYNHCPGSAHCEFYVQEHGAIKPEEEEKKVVNNPKPIRSKKIEEVEDFKVNDRVRLQGKGDGEIVDIVYDKKRSFHLTTVKLDDGKQVKISLDSYISENKINLL